MIENIMTIIFGALLCVLGAINMTGNVSSLHSYHTKRVSEADKKPFGMLVGSGTLVIGVGLVAKSILSMVYASTQNPTYESAGSTVLIAGFVVGIGLNLFAMIKYNKGIF